VTVEVMVMLVPKPTVCGLAEAAEICGLYWSVTALVVGSMIPMLIRVDVVMTNANMIMM